MTKDPEKNKNIDKILAEKIERVKELEAINRTNAIVSSGKPVDEALQEVCFVLTRAWQFPKDTAARIVFDDKEYKSLKFKETDWMQKKSFSTIDDKNGRIEIVYLKKHPDADEGPFLKEERHLLNNIASLITGYLNSITGKLYIKTPQKRSDYKYRKIIYKESYKDNLKLLQKFLYRQSVDRNIFHDLMQYKVKEILLVANLYDAYILENEDRFFEQAMGEIYHLSLSSLPRITGVTAPEDAMKILDERKIDMVVLMVGVDWKIPIQLSQDIRYHHPELPIFLLLNNNSNIEGLQLYRQELTSIDKVFIWNGDSKIFFAMVKMIEDKINVENDTKVGLVRVILLIEDSAKYYSRYLPMLYSIVFEQTQELIAEVNLHEMDKISRMRARTKILLATSYEEALDYFTLYQDYLACVISDAKFTRNGKMDDTAGISFIKYVRSHIHELPTVLQSSDMEYAKMAFQLKATFINKNSETLLQELKSFITYYLGFGHFIYRDNAGRQIAVAKSMKDFERQLRTIPDESIMYHALKNHFSLWLMARGEIQLARVINPIKASDFNSPKDLRKFIVDVIYNYRIDKDKGKVLNFDENALSDERNIVSFGTGSMGGKGRGLAFINTLVNNLDFSEMIPELNIRSPKTSIIGTDEFEVFMNKNKFWSLIMNETDYQQIRKIFMKGNLSYELEKKIKIFIKQIRKPIAIRSSSLFEDSLMQPFAGIFETYVLPNNHPDFNVRVQQTLNAIKMIYASIYAPEARAYFEAVNYKIEEEKMAIIIQELVGNQYGDYYYPHISGTAQSHNYYPVAHMEPEDGFAVIAAGLGKYVVEGEKAWRFSPKFPKLDIVSTKDQYKSSQVYLFAADMKKQDLSLLDGEEAGLIKLDVSEAEKHGTLKHLASVYDPEYDRIEPGLSAYGPRIINFADILKYEYLPLSRTIEVLLNVVREALGSPVEIEYAVDLNKTKNNRPSFYLLQIKPLVGSDLETSIEIDQVEKSKIILQTHKSMGNGKIDTIKDLIYVDPDHFNKMDTEQMAEEVDALNRMMCKKNKKYLLIGPGRWGTRDKFIGIPVTWPQISNAKVIVETALDEFPLDASLGSHFFHNVTSMNVGYISIELQSEQNFISWDLIRKQKELKRTKYFRHVEFENPLEILMDGRKRMCLIKEQ